MGSIFFLSFLQTYGITLFEGKMRNQPKVVPSPPSDHSDNPQPQQRLPTKPIPMVLGILRDSILFIEPERRTVIEEYNLSQLKRWAANPNSFTLGTDRTFAGVCSDIVH